MRITDIDVLTPKTPLDESFAFSSGRLRRRAATLVRVPDDAGPGVEVRLDTVDRDRTDR